MEWTMDEFYDNGGTTAFMDRVAASLGIHASTIKVVSVYEGSLVVNYAIENDNASELADIQAAQAEAFASGSIDLGAPVLSVEQSVSSDADGDTSSSSSSTESDAVTVVGDDTSADSSTEVYVPTVDIVASTTTIVEETTVQYTVEVDDGSTATVSVSEDVVEEPETNNTSSTIIKAGIGAAVLLLMCCCAKCMYDGMNAGEREKEETKKKALELQYKRQQESQ
jgi:hypothetical protein